MKTTIRTKRLPLLPPVPTVTLPPDLAAVVDYLAARHGLNRGVVLATVLTVIGTVAGGPESISWRGTRLALNLHLLLTPAVLTETDGLLQFLSVPMEEEVARLKEQAKAVDDPHQLLESYQKRSEELPPDDPEQAEANRKFRRLCEQLYPHFFGRTLEAIAGDDAYCSTLLLDPTAIVFRVLINEPGVYYLTRLALGRQAKAGTRDYGFVLVAPLDSIERLKHLGIVETWCPIILPQGSAPFSRPTITADEARAKWQAMVEGALTIRRGKSLNLAVSEAGEAVLNRVKDEAEAAAVSSHRPEWYRWAATSCLKVAGILHLLAGDAGEISPTAWEEAGNLTNWLIAVQTRSVGTLRASTAGPKKFHPTKSDDIDRMKRLMRKRPGATFRSLSRSLTKRPTGHWRFIYRCIMELHPEFAGDVVMPTAEQAAAYAAKWRDAGMPSPPEDEDTLWFVRGATRAKMMEETPDTARHRPTHTPPATFGGR
jgi:hypothetical protein